MQHNASKAMKSGSAAPDWSSCAISRAAFVDLVTEKGAALYRDLPWRNVDDPYAVLVSEVMLQQTQVARVMRYWERWLGAFPTVDALAAADMQAVLEMWQGLGYNRRALALKRACETCSAQFGGALPRTADELEKLPGVGPATAAGVVAFAYDAPAVYIETNVRSVFLHELFPDSESVSDKQIAPFVKDTCPERGARPWYYALLDYGADIKSSGINPSRRSKHYARQGKFEGSRREKRSFILKQVLAAPDGVSVEEVAERLDGFERESGRGAVDRALFESLVDQLLADGFFHREGEFLIP